MKYVMFSNDIKHTEPRHSQITDPSSVFAKRRLTATRRRPCNNLAPRARVFALMWLF